jgi:hypothetical protein
MIGVISKEAICAVQAYYRDVLERQRQRLTRAAEPDSSDGASVQPDPVSDATSAGAEWLTASRQPSTSASPS